MYSTYNLHMCKYIVQYKIIRVDKKKYDATENCELPTFEKNHRQKELTICLFYVSSVHCTYYNVYCTTYSVHKLK
jgi:hypothetical protein